MRISAREDISAPIESVFAAVTDIAAIERQALRRGLDVTRLDGTGPPDVGARWEVEFTYQDRRRRALTEITGWDSGQQVLFVTETDGLRGLGEVDLTRLAKARTRLHFAITIRPETFRGRVFLQSLKLVKSGLSQRFRDRVEAFARQIEAGNGY